jgi:hypothetical protein
MEIGKRQRAIVNASETKANYSQFSILNSLLVSWWFNCPLQAGKGAIAEVCTGSFAQVLRA